MGSYIVYIGCFIFTLIAVGRFVHIANKWDMIDVPNMRSSHDSPTSRGGGIIIILASTIVFLYIFISAPINEMGYFVAPLLVGLVGALDDKFSVSRTSRIIGYALAISYGLARALDDNFAALHTPIEWFFLAVTFSALLIFGLWVINSFNFMDGINGLASFQLIFFTLSLSCFVEMEGSIELYVFSLVACVFGFLYWNFPTAKIFLGDSGSTAFGAFIFFLSLYACIEIGLSYHIPLILHAAFLTDTTYTLVARIYRKHVWYEAHKSHAYQIASRSLDNHTKVVAAIFLINVFWLLPLAFADHLGVFPRFVALLMAYIPLTVVIHRIGAGTVVKASLID